MENDVIETVLNEVLEEQKLASQKVDELALIIRSLNETNRKLAANLEAFGNKPTSADLRSTEALINRNADEIKILIAEQPREIKHEKRYLLFPESNAGDYYDAIMKWPFRVLIATYALFMLLYLIQCMAAHW